MSRQILSDITQDFKTEITECGTASKCYCITCTRIRATTFKLFAAWRQVVRGKKDPAPIKIKNLNPYVSSVLTYNQVVQVVQDHANCNGDYAAGIATLIIFYANPPTAIEVAVEYLSGTVVQPKWVGEPEVLTYWYCPNENTITGFFTDHRWVYIQRRTLFKIFNETYHESKNPTMVLAFDQLRKSVPALSGGKFKNQVYIINCGCVNINGSKNIHFIDVAAGGLTIGLWSRYFYYLEKVLGL